MDQSEANSSEREIRGRVTLNRILLLLAPAAAPGRAFLARVLHLLPFPNPPLPFRPSLLHRSSSLPTLSFTHTHSQTITQAKHNIYHILSFSTTLLHSTVVNATTGSLRTYSDFADMERKVQRQRRTAIPDKKELEKEKRDPGS